MHAQYHAARLCSHGAFTSCGGGAQQTVGLKRSALNGRPALWSDFLSHVSLLPSPARYCALRSSSAVSSLGLNHSGLWLAAIVTVSHPRAFARR